MNRFHRVKFIFLLFICFSFGAKASSLGDSLSVSAEWVGVAATKSLQPLWQYANKWGVFSPFEKSESVALVTGHYRFVSHRHFSLSAGVGAVVKNLGDDSFLHQGYVSGRIMKVDFEAGMRSFSPVSVDDRLTTGNFLMSSNARPVPRVGAGFFDYVTLPYTGGYISVKGAMYMGWPLNDDNPKSTRDVWLHEKFAYVRWERNGFKPYAGLIHSAMFGGIAPDGSKIAKDFWATFRAAGSSKLGGGEETNAAGAHMGLWDFGLDYSDEGRIMKFYCMKPFADASGMRLINGRNLDHVLGFYYKSKTKRPISAFSFEWVKTDYQCGSGLADPLDPEENRGIWPGEITESNFREWMARRFPEVNTEGWERKTVYKYLKHLWNFGQPFGGRDTYMNNGMYYQGWAHKGLSTGTPLMHTAEMAAIYAPQWKSNNDMAFVNNRVVALHLGSKGYVNNHLLWRVKYTCSWNRGSYPEEYLNHYSWTPTPGYLFNRALIQHYTMVGAEQAIGMQKKVNIFTSLAYDFGSLYRSFGGQLGIRYNFEL